MFKETSSFCVSPLCCVLAWQMPKAVRAKFLLRLCQGSTCLSVGLGRWDIQCIFMFCEFLCVFTHRQIRKRMKGHWLSNFWQRTACCLLHVIYIVVVGVLTWKVWDTIFPSQICSKLSKLDFLLPNTVVIIWVCKFIVAQILLLKTFIFCLSNLKFTEGNGQKILIL